MRKYWFVCLFIFSSTFCFSQENKSTPPPPAVSKEDPEIIKANGLLVEGEKLINTSQLELAQLKIVEALEIFQKLHDRAGEETARRMNGNICLFQNRLSESMENYTKALSISIEIIDRKGEAYSLNNLGYVNILLNHFSDSLEYLIRARAISIEIKDKYCEEDVVNNLGIAYYRLGRYSDAIVYQKESLNIARILKDKRAEEYALNNIGNAYSTLQQYSESLKYFTQADKIAISINDINARAGILNDIGFTYNFLKNYNKAIVNLRDALKIAKKIKNQYSEAEILLNLAASYEDLKNLSLSERFCLQAISIAVQLNEKEIEGRALNNLSKLMTDTHQYSVSIFLGKLCINIFHSIRKENMPLNNEFQQGYLNDKKEAYLNTGVELIYQNRLSEAQQVINLLKEKEFFGFTNGNFKFFGNNSPALSLTSAERKAFSEFKSLSEEVVSISKQQTVFQTIRQLSKQDKIRLVQLDSQLKVAKNDFMKLLKSLSKRFSKSKGNSLKPSEVQETKALTTALKDSDGAVAVYTLMMDSQYTAIFITKNKQVARKTIITREKLKAKIAKLIDAIKDPHIDARKPSHELYKILIGPIEKDLKLAKAKTIVWELDDTLRYLPFDALYDGKHYMVEKYQQSVITPASSPNLLDKPKKNWSAVGFGVTKPHEGFAALHGVERELNGVVKNNQNGGVLDGQVLLDENFTEKSMLNALQNHPQVVHIASHFNFSPGDDTKSFLLLGDGGHYTLEQFKKNKDLFKGVDLLTLSACETAVGGIKNGTEIEGLGVLAQWLGAKSILATLWSVDDGGTSLLMKEFYRIHHCKPGISRVKALRQAQLAMLYGKIQPTAGQIANRGLRPLLAAKASGLPIYIENPNARFAHPYYWAPFILIGNWR